MSPAVSIRFKNWLKTKTRQRIAIPSGSIGNAAKPLAAGDKGKVKVRAVNRLGWIAETKRGLLVIDYDEMSDAQAEEIMLSSD